MPNEFELPIKQVNLGDFSNKKTSKKDPEVMKQQQALNLKGAGLKVDGIRGPKTIAAERTYGNQQLIKPVTKLAPDLNITRDNTKVLKPKDFDKPVSAQESDFYKAKREVDKIDASADNFIRGKLLPTNVSSYANRKLFDRNKMDANSFTKKEKALLYRVGEAAIKREQQKPGQKNATKAGSEYADYKNFLPKEDYEALMKVVNKSDVGMVKGFLMGLGSPGFNVGTTVGRASFAKNPKTGEIAMTDTYDFKNSYTQGKNGKLKSGYLKNNNTSYGVERREAAKSDQSLTPAQLMKRQIGVILSPQDTIGVPLKNQASAVSKAYSGKDEKLKSLNQDLGTIVKEFNRRFK